MIRQIVYDHVANKMSELDPDLSVAVNLKQII
jgi:hypothetical protein